MADLTKNEQAPVLPYERGAISLAEVGRGTLLRFLPASAVALGGVVAALASPGTPLGPLLGVMAGWVGWVGLGFGGGLLALRKWLYPDARVTGLRSVLAGVLGGLMPLALLRLGLGLTIGPFALSVSLIVIGVAMAVGMFFPWLTETPPEMRDDRVRVSGASEPEGHVGRAP